MHSFAAFNSFVFDIGMEQRSSGSPGGFIGAEENQNQADEKSHRDWNLTTSLICLPGIRAFTCKKKIIQFSFAPKKQQMISTYNTNFVSKIAEMKVYGITGQQYCRDFDIRFKQKITLIYDIQHVSIG